MFRQIVKKNSIKHFLYYIMFSVHVNARVKCRMDLLIDCVRMLELVLSLATTGPGEK